VNNNSAILWIFEEGSLNFPRSHITVKGNAS
jgi:hypothetical protein